MGASSGADPSKFRVLLMASSMRGGGSEQQTALIARYLDRRRFDVHLYLTHRDGELLSLLPDDVTIHSPPPKAATSWFDRIPGTQLKHQAAWFAELARQQSIDVIYDRTFHMTLIAGDPSIDRPGANRIARVSTIVSPPEVAVPMVEKRFVRWKRARLATAYRRSDAVITVSQAAADSAARYYRLPADRFTVIPNPVDVANLRGIAGWAEPKPFADRWQSPEAIRIVCVGRLTPEKGQADLLAAIASLGSSWANWNLPPVHLRFIGDGPDRSALESTWRAMVGPDGTYRGHRVEFVGSVANAAPDISGADLLVLPSHFEGMPNVVLEAFALRTPVVATTGGGTEELLMHRGNSTAYGCPPADPATLGKVLLAACREHRRWAQIAQTAEARVLSHHTVTNAIDAIAHQIEQHAVQYRSRRQSV